MKSILIIEDEVLVAKSIEKILVANSYKVLGIATSVKAAKVLLASSKPDLILCDINLNDNKTGIELMSEVALTTNAPFIFISSYADQETLQKANLTSPFSYITKPFNEKQLLTTIACVFAKIYDELAGPTDRELSILKLVSKGFSTKQIAETLSITFNTVESHRKNLLRKYAVSSMAELICLATSKQWIFYDHSGGKTGDV
jgi:DNA-binding NarL/FixJ family response regulator